MTVPDLTDFEDRFSSNVKSQKEDICHASSPQEDLSREPPSISKFFQRKPTKVASILSNMSNKTVKENETTEKDDKVPYPTSSGASDHKRKRPCSDPQYEAFTNNSFDSIYQLLDECKQLNQYIPSDPIMPSYSYSKTPHSSLYIHKNNTSNLSFMDSHKLPHSFYQSSSQYNASPPQYPCNTFQFPCSNSSYSYKKPSQFNELPSLPPSGYPYYQQQQQQQQQHKQHRQNILTPSWQVAESVASFTAQTATEEHNQLEIEKKEDEDCTTTANGDLEFILQSEAMNILSESIQQNEENIQSFWLTQPAFKRGIQ